MRNVLNCKIIYNFLIKKEALINFLPSLRGGAKPRRSNPKSKKYGLLRFARNDDFDYLAVGV
jgi:hypothetical protein